MNPSLSNGSSSKKISYLPPANHLKVDQRYKTKISQTPFIHSFTSNQLSSLAPQDANNKNMFNEEQITKSIISHITTLINYQKTNMTLLWIFQKLQLLMIHIVMNHWKIKKNSRILFNILWDLSYHLRLIHSSYFAILWCRTILMSVV